MLVPANKLQWRETKLPIQLFDSPQAENYVALGFQMVVLKDGDRVTITQSIDPSSETHWSPYHYGNGHDVANFPHL